jgi:hypothetical protein
LGITAPHDHRRDSLIGIDDEAVVSGLHQRDRSIRSIDFVILVRCKIAHVQLDLPLRKLDLNSPVVQIQESKTRPAVEPYH